MAAILAKALKQFAELVKRLSASELFMDALAALLLTAGFLSALFTVTAIEGGAAVCFWAASAAVAFSVLISRRWWGVLCAAALCLVLFIIYCFFAGGALEGLAGVAEFAAWLLGGAVYEAGITSGAYLTIAAALATLAAAASYFALLRRLFAFPVVAVLQFGAIIACYAFGGGDMSASVLFGAAGLIIALPRVYAAKVGISRARMQAVAAPAALMAVLFALMFVPADTGRWRLKFLSTWADDFSAWSGLSRQRNTVTASNFGLSKVGFATSTGELGGAVILGDDKYLRVETSKPVLLKGRVLDYYDGHSWRAQASAGDMRFNSPLWGKTRREAFDTDKPAFVKETAKEAKEIYERLTAETDVTVNIIYSGFNTLFAPENVTRLSVGDGFKGADVYFNSRSELFLHTRAPLASYTVTARVWNTGLSDFDALMTRLEALTEPTERYTDILKIYAQLPTDLPEAVRDTASEITEGAGSPYMKAKAIREWLSNNAEYTLTPDTPPKDADFTAHFLETREGYCVYFATAMTVLARSAGLPARYVQGFALEAAGADGYYATGQTAHAWSEVYLDGIGWLAFDPLNRGAARTANAANAAPDGFERGYPEFAAPSWRPVDIPAPVIAASAIPARSASDYLWIPVLAVALICAFVWLINAAPAYMRRKWAYAGLKSRYGGAGGILNAIYTDALKLLALGGLIPKEHETLVTFPERADRFVGIDGFTLSKVAEPLMRLYYKESEPTEAELEYAAAYHAALEALRLETMGKTRYFFKRVINTST